MKGLDYIDSLYNFYKNRMDCGDSLLILCPYGHLSRKHLPLGRRGSLKTYSTENKYIQKIGTEEIYDAAIDQEEEINLGHRKYFETDISVAEEI